MFRLLYDNWHSIRAGIVNAALFVLLNVDSPPDIPAPYCFALKCTFLFTANIALLAAAHGHN